MLKITRYISGKFLGGRIRFLTQSLDSKVCSRVCHLNSTARVKYYPFRGTLYSFTIGGKLFRKQQFYRIHVFYYSIIAKRITLSFNLLRDKNYKCFRSLLRFDRARNEIFKILNGGQKRRVEYKSSSTFQEFALGSIDRSWSTRYIYRFLCIDACRNIVSVFTGSSCLRATSQGLKPLRGIHVARKRRKTRVDEEERGRRTNETFFFYLPPPYFIHTALRVYG